MSRIRTIKPDFFRHEELFEAEKQSKLPLRLAFAGLWTCCDREGRFRWKPRLLKLDVLPYDEIDFDKILTSLAKFSFIVKYEIAGEIYGCIPSWPNHQVINIREAKSKIPPPPLELHVHACACTDSGPTYNGINIPATLRAFLLDRDGHKCKRCGSTENLEVDHIFPRSMKGTHAPANLRILCKSCNCARPVSGQALIDDLAKDGLTLDDKQRICMHVHAQGEEEGKGIGKEKEGEDINISLEPQDLPDVIFISLIDKTEYGIKQFQIDKWGEFYPAVDILQELKNIAAWNLANPQRRKTKKGILRHINTWLAGKQDKGGSQRIYSGNKTLAERNEEVVKRALANEEGAI